MRAAARRRRKRACNRRAAGVVVRAKSAQRWRGADAARPQEADATTRDREKEREAYKYFDEAVITVKARPAAAACTRHAPGG